MRIVFIFLVAMITSFLLIGAIDYVYSPEPTSQWNEEINVPPFFEGPLLPAVMMILGASICGALILLFRPYVVIW